MTLVLMLACATDAPVDAPEIDTPSTVLTVYSGRSEALVQTLFDQAGEDLGLTIEVQYGKTPEMVTRLVTEGAESPADLIFAQDSGYLGALSARGALAPVPAALLEQVDPRFRDSGGNWIGTSGRLRVLVYNQDALNPDTLPNSLEELADPKWKGKLGWAPGNSSLQAHVSALRQIWGEERTTAWLEGVQANQARTYPKNSPQVEAAHTGEIEIGWVNHYYLYRQDLSTTRAANYSFPTEGDAGNILMVSGLGIRKGSPDAEAAQRLIEWMVSESAQTRFAQDNYEYPTRPGVPTHADVPGLDTVSLATVDQAWLADVAPTRALLQELGLQ